MSKNVVIAGAVILVLVVLGWYFTQPKVTVPPVPESVTQTPTASSEASKSAKIVSITVGGYDPKDITIKMGDTITFENTDTANHTVNSDPHPTHTLYPVLNIGRIAAGEKKSVMFDVVGKFTFHDHLNPSLTGSVTVQ